MKLKTEDELVPYVSDRTLLMASEIALLDSKDILVHSGALSLL